MNSEISASCVTYGLYDEDTIIGFCGVIHQPHPINMHLKRVSRLVILPDYQGIGLGTKFLNSLAEYYKSKGWDLSIVTSAKNMIMSLRRNPNWFMVRYGVNRIPQSGNIECNRTSIRTNCKTASFQYVG